MDWVWVSTAEARRLIYHEHEGCYTREGAHKIRTPYYDAVAAGLKPCQKCAVVG